MSLRMTEKNLLSVWFARMSRHCTMGRPASIIVAKRRVKVTMSFVPTPVPIWKLSALDFFLTFVGTSCCARSRVLTASSVSASMRPLRSSPVRARASQTNSAITMEFTERLHLGSKSLHMGFGGADAVARTVVEEGVAPRASAACAVRRREGEWARELGGETATLFDLASVTKPMFAVAAQVSGLPLDAPLGDYVGEARG